MMKDWFVVNTKTHEESKAFFNLKNQGFNAYLPRYKKIRRHARKIDTVLSPLFPKYLFVEFDIDMHNWSRINSTIGVIKLIKFGFLPSPIPKRFIDQIRDREDANGFVILNRQIKMAKGTKVNIINGALEHNSGVFECQDDNERVTILLNLMGRDVRVRLPASAISAVR